MTGSRRRRDGVSGLLRDITDELKDFVDDEVVDRARTAERDLRRTGRHLFEDSPGRDRDTERRERTTERSSELSELRSAIAELSRKVARLNDVSDRPGERPARRRDTGDAR